MILGSEDLQLAGFEIAPTFGTLFTSARVRLPASPQVYPFDVPVRGAPLPFSEIDAAVIGPPMLIGMLTVDAARLSVGDFSVIVNSDMNRTGVLVHPRTSTEGLFGMAELNAIPEPATLSLLGLASLTLLRFRRRF